MKEKNKEEYKYINIARAIGIILVVCGHCDNIGKIEHFVGLFHMAIFIFISGFLFKDRKFKNHKELFTYLLKKVKRLYFFYVKWEIVFFVLTNLLFKIGFYSSDIVYGGKIIQPINSINYFFIQILKIILGMGREPFCGAFWYIITTIIITIIFSLIRFLSNKLEKKKIMEFISVFICFIIGCLMAKYFNIPRVSPAFTFMIIYYLGVISYRYKDILKFNKLLIAIVSIILLIVLSKKRKNSYEWK